MYPFTYNQIIDQLKTQLETVKIQFEHGGILKIGNSHDCHCKIATYKYIAISDAIDCIQTIFNHKVLNWQNHHSIFWYDLDEFTICEHELRELNTILDFEQRLADTKHKIQEYLDYVYSSDDNEFVFDIDHLTKIANPDTSKYKDCKITIDQIKEIVRNRLKCPFTMTCLPDKSYKWRINIVYSVEKSKISPFLARQAVTGAILLHEQCGITFEPISSLSHVFVNECGHIFGPLAENIRFCPSCRVVWHGVRVNINELPQINSA